MGILSLLSWNRVLVACKKWLERIPTAPLFSGALKILSLRRPNISISHSFDSKKKGDPTEYLMMSDGLWIFCIVGFDGTIEKKVIIYFDENCRLPYRA